MDSGFILYIAVGKLLTFFGKKFVEDNGIGGFIGRLMRCGLCWGFWTYTLLSLLLGEVLFTDFFYIFGVSEVITGAFVSFFVHLITLGWKEQFEIIIVE